MAKQPSSFRVGRVRAFLRGQVWYLSYFEQGQRRQPRVGPDQQAARTMAAEINGQLAAGAPSALGFQAITFPALRDRWLDHHEHVRRSSLNTIGRYRSATEHLLDFVATVRPLKRVSDLHPIHVEEFTFATILQDGSVDPLIRNELMGHAPMAQTSGGGLGMTTVYTHTRPETKRRQLDQALSQLPAIESVGQWLAAHDQPDLSVGCLTQRSGTYSLTQPAVTA